MTSNHHPQPTLHLLLVCTTIATLLIALSLTPRPIAQAATTIGDGTPASCSEAALETALSNGGDITFNCGNEPHTITVSSPKTVAADTTMSLDGGGLITLSGGDNVRIFAVEQGGTLTLTNLTLTGGNAGEEGGGALHNTGTTTLNQCSLTSNTRQRRWRNYERQRRHAGSQQQQHHRQQCHRQRRRHLHQQWHHYRAQQHR